MAAADLEAARAWWIRVRGDLESARTLLLPDHLHPENAVYLCQQAAEKALKAFLTFHAMEFEKTHDLTRLLAEASRIDPTLESLREAAQELSPYATLYRYPGDLSALPLDEALDAMRDAEEIVAAVGARLEGITPATP